MTKTQKCSSLLKKNYNCAQAVACSFAQELNIPEKTLKKLAEGFGGGIAGTKQTCGALCAMLMVYNGLKQPKSTLGLPSFNEKAKSRVFMQEMFKEFEEKYGSTQCEELLKIQKNLKGKPGEFGCEQLCHEAVRITEKSLAVK